MSKTPLPLHRTQKPPMTPQRLRRLMLVGSLALLALCWSVLAMLKPATQGKIVVTAGAEGGIYYNYAQRYAQILKRDGITLDIRSSSGSVENFQRLRDENSEYEVGFIQSGTGNSEQAPGVQTIAAISYEPIWVFYQGSATYDRLSQLRGKRISLGLPGSGLRIVANDLLTENGITTNNSTLVEMSGAAAYEQLRDNKIDAAFFIGRADGDLIHTLLNSGIKLMSFSQADALVQKFPSLSKITYPRGATSLINDRPAHDVTLLAATAMLVSKESLHPALAYLLLDAANVIHNAPDFFTPRNYFPNQNIEDFTISDETRRYFKSGRPFLQRYLPFWLANFIERRFTILLPFIAVLFGLIQAVPRIYEASMKKRLVVWYKEIHLLEEEIWSTRNPPEEKLAEWHAEIEEIDANANQIDIPQRYYGDVYALKQAIRVVRDRISEAAHQRATTTSVQSE
ncbi:TAXI family TRAP transporter solute-binding subunit [Herbaspirillum sp. RV1423]|uniref:TAXI family TRAP transporter solute-binding subunit n=1 Tax=Herbaspirillum sp. RV1423 TaxID=1443993 RepID=UPI0005542F4D|nr:TAXI family TRAP transporter solute-binding subunit [Herbaspirillum sp. RV1423]